MAKISGIYSITSPSGSRYVGSAVDIGRRWSRHRVEMRSGIHGNAGLRRAAAKYGVENIRFSVLLVCRPQDVLFYEQRAIDIINPEYNIARIAGSSAGIVRSAEFKRKVSEGSKGRIVTAETRAKIGEKHRGKTIPLHMIEALRERNRLNPLSIETLRERAKAMHTPEARAKQTAAKIGRPVSEETRTKISAALKGHLVSEETRQKIKRTKLLRKSKVAVTQHEDWCKVACTLQQP